MAEPAATPAHWKPLGIGDILDVALRLYRRGFRQLYLATLALNAPIFAFSSLFQSWYFGQFKALQEPSFARGLAEDPAAAARFGAVFLGGLGGFLVLYPLGYQLLVAAVTWGTGRAWLDEPWRVREAYAAVGRRFPAIAATHLLQVLLIGAACLLASLPGLALILLGGWAAIAGVLLAVATSVAVALVLALRWLLMSEVIVLEQRWGFRALSRSAQLMAGSVEPGIFGNQKLRASVLLLLLYMVTGVLAFAASLPRLALEVAYNASPLVPGSDPSAMPLAALLATTGFELFAQTAILPFVLVTLVLFYYDTRIRREGLDLELLAGRLAGTAKPAVSAGAPAAPAPLT